MKTRILMLADIFTTVFLLVDTCCTMVRHAVAGIGRSLIAIPGTVTCLGTPKTNHPLAQTAFIRITKWHNSCLIRLYEITLCQELEGQPLIPKKNDFNGRSTQTH
jgi:hypothetical protein